MKLLIALVALIVAMVVAAPAHDSGVPDQNDPNFISAVMRAHWYWRRLHCAQDLVWDTELADAARQDIEECPKNAEHASGRAQGRADQ